MEKILVVVDMQNDFIDGLLGTEEARSIVESVYGKIIEFGGQIFVTQDTHSDNYLETLEGRHLPVEHCIANTEGWLINSFIRNALKSKNYAFIEKEKFDSNEFWNYMREISKDHIVFISEQNAPDDFVAIWSKPFTRTLDVNKNNQFKVTEKLFVHQNNLKYIQH